MKLMHLADLHLGKRVNGFSMMEDQEYILNQILEIMEDEQPDGLLIAGDVYDKTIPPAEAVRLMDDFLTAVAAKHVPVFLISGNHGGAGGLRASADAGERHLDLAGIRRDHPAPHPGGPVGRGEHLPRSLPAAVGGAELFSGRGNRGLHGCAGNHH